MTPSLVGSTSDVNVVRSKWRGCRALSALAAVDFLTCLSVLLFWRAVVDQNTLQRLLASSVRELAGWALLSVFFIAIFGGYRLTVGLMRLRETALLINAASVSSAVMLGADLARNGFSWAALVWTVVLMFAMALSLVLTHQVSISICRHIGCKNPYRVLICGSGESARNAFSMLSNRLTKDARVVAVYDRAAEFGQRIVNFGYHHNNQIAVTIANPDEDVLQGKRIDLVYMALPGARRQEIQEIMDAASRSQTTVVGGLDVEQCSFDYRVHDGVAVAGLRELDLGGLVYRVCKRVFDFLFAGCVFLVTLPLWLLLALLIKLDSRGPVFFKQQRVGENGRPFLMYKFRTMKTELCGDAPSPTQGCDPRVTRVGRWLRKSSLDEIPQLINILLGDMSFVGPRPEMTYIVQQYDAYQKLRLQAKPGLTGVWQLSADRNVEIHQNCQYDLYYLKHRGFFFDLAVIAHTFLYAVRGA